MATINKNFDKLQGAYLFVEIAKRAKEFSDKNPGVELMRLGIGDTTLPLTSTTIFGLQKGVEDLSRKSTYKGYGDPQGDLKLRTALRDYYSKR